MSPDGCPKRNGTDLIWAFCLIQMVFLGCPRIANKLRLAPAREAVDVSAALPSP